MADSLTTPNQNEADILSAIANSPHCRSAEATAMGSIIEACKIRIILLGETSCGKSSFLNALLERKLLPTGETPTSTYPVHISSGPITEALFYHDLRTLDAKRELEIIGGQPLFGRQWFAEKWQKAHLTLSDNAFRNTFGDSIVWIDTPGSNAANRPDDHPFSDGHFQEYVAENYLSPMANDRADLIVYFLNYQRSLSENDLSWLKFLNEILRKANSGTKLWIVLNKIDLADPTETDSQTQIAFIRERIENVLPDLSYYFHTLSAKDKEIAKERWQSFYSKIEQEFSSIEISAEILSRKKKLLIHNYFHDLPGLNQIMDWRAKWLDKTGMESILKSFDDQTKTRSGHAEIGAAKVTVSSTQVHDRIVGKKGDGTQPATAKSLPIEYSLFIDSISDGSLWTKIIQFIKELLQRRGNFREKSAKIITIINNNKKKNISLNRCAV